MIISFMKSMKMCLQWITILMQMPQKPQYGKNLTSSRARLGRGGGGVLSYMGYIGMSCCEGYGFQAV